MVGDSPYDAKAAAAAGIPFLWYGRPEGITRLDAVLERLDDLGRAADTA